MPGLVIAVLVACMWGGQTWAVAASCPASNGDAYSASVLNDHPVAYYRLDESSGTEMCDSSSEQNDGTYGSSSGITLGVPGALADDSDTAVGADGQSGVIGQSASDSGITGSSSFTLEGWFKATKSPENNAFVIQNQVLAAIGSAGAGSVVGLATWDDHACGTDNSESYASTLALDEYDASNCWNTATVNVNLYDGNWHYLAITYDASSNQVTGYVDGQSLGAQTATATLDLGAGPVLVGNWVDTDVNQPLYGDADEVAVYPSALPASHIVSHYDASQPEITFATTSAQAAVSGPRGGTASLPITINRSGGASNPVTLAVNPLPTGVTLTGGQTIAAGSDTTTLQFSIAAGANTGQSQIQLSATSTGAVSPANLTGQFTVTDPQLTWATTSAQASVSGAQGTTADLPVAINRPAAATDAVTVAVSGLPSGVTLTGGQTIPADTDSTTLQFAIAADAPPITDAPITITATSPDAQSSPPLSGSMTVTASPIGAEPTITLQPLFGSYGSSGTFGYPGRTAAVAASILRSAGADGPVTLTVTGLPAGVTLTAGATIPAASNSTTLTFAIAAGAPYVNTPIDVSGTSPGATVGPVQSIDFTVTDPVNVLIESPSGAGSVPSVTMSLVPCSSERLDVFASSALGPVSLTATATGDTSGLHESVSLTSGVDDGTLTVSRSASGASGGQAVITLTGTSGGSTARATVTVDLASDAAQGLYVTQGPQPDYGELKPSGSAASGDAYQGSTLVAGKKTVVRLYSEAGTSPEVGAELYGYHDGHALPGSPLKPDYGPSGSPVSGVGGAGGVVSDAELESDANAFTFTLPYSWVGGHYQLGGAYPGATTIKLVGKVIPSLGTSCGASSDFTLRNVPFTEVGANYQPLLEPIAMTIDGQSALPSPAQVFAEAAAAFPLPDGAMGTTVEPYLVTTNVTDIVNSTTYPCNLPSGRNITVDGKQVTAGSVCFGDREGELLARVQSLVPHPLATAHVVGVVNAGYGVTNAVPGTFSVVQASGRPLTSDAHEIGHQYGLLHASKSCGGGTNGQVGVDWPPDQAGHLNGIAVNTTSEPYDFIATGLNGFQNAYDFMSYCAQIGNYGGSTPLDPNDWLSPRYWQQLIGSDFGTGAPHAHVAHAAGLAGAPGGGAGAAAAPALATTAAVDPSRLEVTGFVTSTGGVQISGVGPQVGSAPAPGGSADVFTLTARGADGQVLSSVPMAATTGGHIDAPGFAATPLAQLTGDIPAAGVESIQVSNGSSLSATATRPARPPRVTLLAPRAGMRVGGEHQVVVRWRASSPEHLPLTVWVDYSADGGRTWRTIFAGPDVSHVSLPSAYFSASKDARVRVRVNDGFNETMAVSRSFRALGAPPYVTVQTSFSKRLRYEGDASLQLAGSAVGQDGRELAASRLRWYDGPFLLGTGPVIVAPPLPPGVNRLSLVARGTDGAKATATTVVHVAHVELPFLKLSLPARVTPKARRLTFRASASIPTALRIGSRSLRLSRRRRTYTVALRPGSAALLLHLSATAEGVVTPFAAVLQR